MVYTYQYSSSFVFLSPSFFWDALVGNIDDLTDSKKDDKDSKLSGAEKPVSVLKEEGNVFL